MEQLKESLNIRIKENAEAVEKAIIELCDRYDEDIGKLYDAEKYSLVGGGKRVRPLIVNEFCKLFGGKTEQSMPLACAIEFVHTYSLIHDDLPCMDDDDLRRGKPSNHKQFGYATALLAGDALLTRSFGIIASADSLDFRQKSEAVRTLSLLAGEIGMIGGQIIDLDGEIEKLEFEKLLRLHSMKTGALMECSARLGCIAAGFFEGSREAEAAALYARNVGIAFQVIDDILDEIEDEAVLGKNHCSDAEHNKTTFLTYFEEKEAREYAMKLTSEAVSAISEYEESTFLSDFAVYLLDRKN